MHLWLKLSLRSKSTWGLQGPGLSSGPDYLCGIGRYRGWPNLPLTPGTLARSCHKLLSDFRQEVVGFVKSSDPQRSADQWKQKVGFSLVLYLPCSCTQPSDLISLACIWLTSAVKIVGTKRILKNNVISCSMVRSSKKCVKAPLFEVDPQLLPHTLSIWKTDWVIVIFCAR